MVRVDAYHLNTNQQCTRKCKESERLHVSEPLLITQNAVEDHVKQVAEGLKVNKSWVYRFLGNAEHDPYSRFIALYNVTREVNKAGANLFFNDFQARHRAGQAKAQGVLWEVLLAEAMRINQDALAEAATRGPELRVKALKAIEALQFLIAQEKANGQ